MYVITLPLDVTRTQTSQQSEYSYSRKRKHSFSGYYISADHKKQCAHTTSFFSKKLSSRNSSHTHSKSTKPRHLCSKYSTSQRCNRQWSTNKLEIRPSKRPKSDNRYVPDRQTQNCNRHLTRLRSTLSGSRLSEQSKAYVKTMLQQGTVPDRATCSILLTIYAKNKQFEDAEQLMFGVGGKRSYLDKWQVPVNIFIYSAYLGVCAKTCQAGAAQRVLNTLKDNVRRKKGIFPNEVICINLLTVYAETGEFKKAERLVFGDGDIVSYLEEWRVPVNIKIYNAYLGVCAKTRQAGAAQRVLDRLKINERSRKGVRPNDVTCVSLLSVYAGTEEFDKAERLVFGDGDIVSYLEEWRVPVNIKIYNAYLGVCAKTRQAGAAQRVLDILKTNVGSRKGVHPNDVTCISLLTVYAGTGEFEKAERLVFGGDDIESYLDKWQVPVNIFIYSAYLGVCAKTRQAGAAQRVLDILKTNVRSREGVRPDDVTCTNFLSVYAGTGEFEKAERLVFGGDDIVSYLDEWRVIVNIRIYNAYLGVCAKTRQAGAAQRVLDILKTNVGNRKGILPDDVTCTNFLSVYAGTGEFEKAERLVFGGRGRESYLDKWRVLVNIFIYNAYLGVCAKTRQAGAAQRVLDILKINERSRKGVRPNDVTCVSLLSVYAETREFEKAERLVFGGDDIVSYLDEWRIPVDIFIYSAYLGVCAKTRQAGAAQRVLDILKTNVRRRKGVHPNYVACLILLTVYAGTGEFKKAERLVFGDDDIESYLDEWRVPVDIFIYSAYLGVCAKTRQAGAAQRVLDILKANVSSRKGVRPNDVTCTNFLSVYARTGEFEKAERLVFGGDDIVSYLDEWRVLVNIRIYNAYLGVCAKTRQAGAAQRVLDILKTNVGNRKGILPDDVTCINFLSVYAGTGEFDKAERLVFGGGGRESYLDEWNIPHMNFIYALWAVVDKDKFDENIAKLKALDMCYENMGLNASELNVHIDRIFKATCNAEKGRGVPFEFAKALFLYFYNKNCRAITTIVTGYNCGETLKSKLTTFLNTELNFDVNVPEHNLGLLEIKSQHT